MPTLARIALYPIKSFDPVEVERAEATSAGRLKFDRAWALFDADDRFVNGKRSPAIHKIRAQFDLVSNSVQLAAPTVPDAPPPARFDLRHEMPQLERWCSDYFRQPVRLRHDLERGFPDDTDACGPTIISTATLTTVAAWFALPVEQIRLRFRANLEFDTPVPFWEERLYGLAERPRPFRIGALLLEGANPCQRCAVPTRNPESGEPLAHFQAQFSIQRAATLPAWAERSRFNHYYRLAVNTRILSGQSGQQIFTGDPVDLPI